MATSRNKRRRAHAKRTLARTIIAHAPALSENPRKLREAVLYGPEAKLVSSVYRGGEIWPHAKGQYLGYSLDYVSNETVFAGLTLTQRLDFIEALYAEDMRGR